MSLDDPIGWTAARASAQVAGKFALLAVRAFFERLFGRGEPARKTG